MTGSLHDIGFPHLISDFPARNVLIGMLLVSCQPEHHDHMKQVTVHIITCKTMIVCVYRAAGAAGCNIPGRLRNSILSAMNGTAES